MEQLTGKIELIGTQYGVRINVQKRKMMIIKRDNISKDDLLVNNTLS